MPVKIKLFANLAESVGAKEIEVDALDVREAFETLEERYEKLHGEIFKDEEQQKIRDNITVIKDGRNITYLDGLDTELKDGDELSVFPLVGGG
ncbi:MAG: ubiquitin-like small modifier protein 1 [Candidatus Saliniplasma sp.]